MTTTARTLFSSTLMLGLAMAPAGAQQAPAVPESGEAWAVSCKVAEGVKRCSMTQNLMTDQNGTQQRLLTVILQLNPDDEDSVLLVLPHGLYLPAGTKVRIGEGEPLDLLIQTSDPNGVYAGTPLTDALLKELQSARRLVVSFQTSRRQPIDVPVTLAGLSAAYEKMREFEGAQ